MAVMNVTTYLFTILAARVLGPVEYGALAAVMGVLLVLNVLSLGLQATGARRVSAVPGDMAQIEHEVLRTTYVCAGALGLVALLATPLVSHVLNLDSWATAALIAVTVVPLTVMGGQAGVLQGERRWKPLAAIYVAFGVSRLVLGLIAFAVEADTFGALLGVAIGAFAPVAVGWWALRHPGRRAEHDRTRALLPAPYLAPGGVLRETFHNSHALLAFFALSNVDVLIARSTLDGHQAGLYAGGLILTKAVLFLPQFVVVIVFPSMASSQSARRMNLLALGMVLAMGLTTVVGTAVLSGLTVTFVGGPEYSELQHRLWLFALLGTVLAMLQVMVYNIVARQRQRAVFVMWAALVVLLIVAPLMDTVDQLVVCVLTIDTALFVVLLAQAGIRTKPAAEVTMPVRE
ncbi:oligosaccharide flippase family protein [Nocardioides mesophilus]|uniref:Oligosaccharide flippase family protein n=2 Tax=Nocardioides mesophilus TaxID=433659 RepID=A0A7G9RGL5_9ACTN|nr:oligosaccharide flippase family protein [Nocardioides mesophilus]